MVSPRGFLVKVSSVFGIFWSTVFVCAYGCVRHGEYTAGGSSLLPTAVKPTRHLAISAGYCWMDLLPLVEASSWKCLANRLALATVSCFLRFRHTSAKGANPMQGIAGILSCTV